MARPKCTHADTFQQIRMPDEAFALRLFQISESYLQAGKCLLAVDNGKEWRPAYFLLCHAIELGLKAHLAAKGITTNLSQDRLGHCLSCLFGAVARSGLRIEMENIESRLDHIRDYAELMRYPDLELKQRIAPNQIVEVCEAIRSAVQRANGAKFFKGMLDSYEVVEFWHDRSLAASRSPDSARQADE